MARVTVFIPTFNRAGLVRGAIESVLAQTFTDFRLHVSDNASDDETPQVVASFDDPRLTYTRQPHNLGLIGNHSWCLEQADTDYSLIMSDDDLAYPQLLERTVAALDGSPQVGMVHSSFDVIGSRGEMLRVDENWTYGLRGDTVESSERFVTEAMKWSCRICASTALMRTKALPAGGMGDEDLPAVDFDMWLQMAGSGWEFAFIDQPLAAYRIHAATHSAAFGQPSGPGYIQGVEIVSRLLDIKLRFLEQHNGVVADPGRMRRLAERARGRELVMMARNMTLPERRRNETFRALARVARVDPRVLARPDVWKLAVASVLGPRLVERIKARGVARGEPARRDSTQGT